MSDTIVWEGWTVERKIGEGSFGTVYEISRTEFGKTYKSALKVITIPRDDDEVREVYGYGMDEKSVSDYFYQYVEEIAKEIQLMSDLQGLTNIVSYQDHKVIPHDDGVHWDIMIRMELLSPLTKQDLSEEEVIKLGRDICAALEICRQRQILHRDIKPQNIFVNEHGDYKIGDFGIARTIEKTVSSLSKKGTYDYMAPEVFAGKKYGHTADIYSLAVVMYKYLNDNRLPFLPKKGPIRPKDKEKALDKKMSGEAVSPALTGSRELNEILKKALSFNPDDRYQTAGEFLDALKGLSGADTAGRHADHKDLPRVEKPERTEKEEVKNTAAGLEAGNAGQIDPDEKTIFENPNKGLKENDKKQTGSVVGHKKRSPVKKIIIAVLVIAALGSAVFLNKDKIQELFNKPGTTADDSDAEESTAIAGDVRITIPDGFEKAEESSYDEEYVKDLSRITLRVQKSSSIEADKAVIENVTSDDLLSSYKEQFDVENNKDLLLSLIYYSDDPIKGCPARVAQTRVSDSKEIDIRIYQVVMLTDKIYTWTLYDMDGTNRDAFAECIENIYIETDGEEET